MNSKILYIIFLLLSLSGQGQVSIQNLSLTKPDSNILYVGINNKIKVLGLSNLNNVKIVANGLPVFLTGEFFYVFASAPGKKVLKAYKNRRQIAEKTFIILKIPDFQTGIGKFHDTTLSLQQISTIRTVLAYLPNCILDYRVWVKSFDLEIIYSDGSKEKLGRGDGSKLSPEQLVQIGNLKSGDKLNFDNIRIAGPDDVFVPGFYIVIK